jgi:hypothetical protein
MAGLDPAIHVFLYLAAKAGKPRGRVSLGQVYPTVQSPQTCLAHRTFRGYSLSRTLPSSSG